MPLRWEPGKNPYVFNYFSKLEVGPSAVPVQITQQADNRAKSVNQRPIMLCGVELDEHAIREASTALRQPDSHAEELLLVHPHTRRERTKLKGLIEELNRLAVLPERPAQIPLHHPLAVFWFVPEPGPESAEMPEWREFGFVEPGDDMDRELDIVFDC